MADNKKLFEEYIEQMQSLKFNDEIELDRLLRKGKMLIKNCSDNAGYIKDFASISFYPMFAPTSDSYKQKCWQSGKLQIINLVNTMLEEEKLFNKSSNSQKITRNKKGSNIFIVHGHDNAIKVSVARFVEKLGLKAVILHEQPNKGRTIIEKFEEHANSSSFAIIILTPDDIGYPKDKEKEKSFRARQNVIFELGFFCGALGRKHICVLYKDSIEIPNDYLGVVYLKIDDSHSWQLSLAKEMKESGLIIDMNKVCD